MLHLPAIPPVPPPLSPPSTIFARDEEQYFFGCFVFFLSVGQIWIWGDRADNTRMTTGKKEKKNDPKKQKRKTIPVDQRQ